VPPALGDSVVTLKSFSEDNPAGPVFTQQGASFDKNAQLAKIVKEKMTQIYPRLARRKFDGVEKVTLGGEMDDNGPDLKGKKTPSRRGSVHFNFSSKSSHTLYDSQKRFAAIPYR
jgi:hypothetical protein